MIKLKNSYSKDSYIIFNNECIKILEKNNIMESFNYSEITSFTIKICADKFIYNTNLITFPNIANCIVTLDMKYNNTTYSYISKCNLQTIYKLIDLQNNFNNFNVTIEEEHCIRNLIAVPLILYSNFKEKFLIGGKPFSRLEATSIFFSCFVIFILLTTITHNDMTENYIFILFFAIISFIISSIGVINEYKKHKLSEKLQIISKLNNNTTVKNTEYGIIDVIKNNIPSLTEPCYKYLTSVRYNNIVIFLFNIFVIVYSACKILNFMS